MRVGEVSLDIAAGASRKRSARQVLCRSGCDRWLTGSAGQRNRTYMVGPLLHECTTLLKEVRPAVCPDRFAADGMAENCIGNFVRT